MAEVRGEDTETIVRKKVQVNEIEITGARMKNVLCGKFIVIILFTTDKNIKFVDSTQTIVLFPVLVRGQFYCSAERKERKMIVSKIKYCNHRFV